MKKLIVLSVVFALVASAAFAVDLGGVVIGGVNLFAGESGDGANEDIVGGAQMKRIRIEGGGEAGEGKFGGYFRLNHEDKDNGDYGGLAGNAWWKPIDQLKIIVGSNGGDGFYGKEGVTGWMFYQTVSDAATIVNPGNCWGGSYSGGGDDNIIFRNVFFGGDGGGDALRLEITPIDILGINVVLPYYNGTKDYGAPDNNKKAEDIFKSALLQLDLKLDFGNIALTYKGVEDAGDVFVYYGGSFGDLSLDVGFHYDMADGAPMGVGAGVKYASDAFGLKFRVAATLGGDDKFTKVLADVMPFFSLGDNLTAFVSAGFAMVMNEDDTFTGWHFNPYIQIGEEWGSKFLIGVKVSNDAAAWRPAGAPWVDEKVIKWSVPISIMVNF
jgi:hypothetical protein